MPVYLKDYRAPVYTIKHVELKVELDEEATVVTSQLSIEKQDLSSTEPLVLDGGDFEVRYPILINGVPLTPSEYRIENNKFTLYTPPAVPFTLTFITQNNPKENTDLEGLYKAGDILTTQCESQGFRNITFFLDRPDVLATYTTEIHADKTKYPVLLANGNLKHTGPHPVDTTKHIMVYEDPIPKPSYLFATVAGDLGLNEDVYTTASGRKVTLRIFVPKSDLPKTAHAMAALKEAMAFDEKHYGREYDLDIYNIVGVPQFNAGAMENKGLNIFNNSSLLVHPDTATDTDFEWVYSVVGHEYFHNWRGNRVTVKQWFELSLKEGFATITEQEFVQNLFHSLVPRIGDINILKTRQFTRDAGPLAQAVRPSEYETTSNLYTSTIYMKGAELLNMLKYLLGSELYKKGCSIYFAKNDGKAADIEAFLAAMEEASGRDLSQFLIWYEQEGTPQLDFDAEYDEHEKTYTLKVSQSCPPTHNQPEKKPLLIPIALALLNKHGEEIPLQLADEHASTGTTRILELTESTATFKFVGVEEKPVPSLMRHFSAPVKIGRTPVSYAELKFLLKHDSDPINRWLAGETIALNAILQIIHDLKNGKEPTLDMDVVDAYRAVLKNSAIEPRLVTELLSFPKESVFFEHVKPVDPHLIQRAREFFVNGFARCCYEELKATYLDYSTRPVSDEYTPAGAGIRSLKNLALAYLMRVNTPEANELCRNQLIKASNMTDVLGALTPYVTLASEDRAVLQQEALDNFKTKWKHDAVTIEHLFGLYAISQRPDALDQIILLSRSDLFNKENPSHVYSLLSRFYSSNPSCFHDPSGKAYEFFADLIIELDQINAMTAADLAPAFESWSKLEPVRQAKMLEQLFRLHALPLRPEDPKMEVAGVTYLSGEVKEIISKNIKDALAAKASSVVNPHRLFGAGAEEATGGIATEEKRVSASLV